ncbi:MAG: fibronectin type III domain-containing protein, partial [Saprospiraceae bacterium]|nr:fibronectin type III domain-containing protein [Saprospiraceae bacterium]
MRKIIGSTRFLALILLSTPIFSQSTFTVGAFDTQNQQMPLNAAYPTPYGDRRNSMRAQYVYRADELISSGAKGGYISEIGFFVVDVDGSLVHENFTIGLGSDDLFNEALIAPGWFGSGIGPNFTTVFGPINYSPVDSVNKHILSTQFDWDQTKNLFVQICHSTNSGDNSNNAIVQLTQTDFRGNRTKAEDNNPIICTEEGVMDPQNGPTNLRPVLYLKFCYEPDSFSVNDISSISGEIGWTHPDGGPSDQYEYVYGDENFVIGGTGELGTGITNDTFANISGLNGDETYTFFVRSLCGNGFSRWAGPFQFTTDPSCGDVYNFNNFPTNTYDTSIYAVTTLCPDEPDVALGINVFDMSFGPGDELRIYNGNSLLSPPMDTLTGVGLIGKYQSTTASGCLTFEFVSDTIVSLLDLGWLFEVTCATLGNDSCY